MENKDIISNWLEKLQRESWNLELLISGFSIFLLIQGGDILLETLEDLQLHYDNDRVFVSIMILLFGFAYLASKMLTINLIIHVILRGVWIGTIGLRSVQQKIDFERLKYTPFFVERLRKKVSSLDDLLIRLDIVCSVIFAFTFLIIFMFFSIFLYTLFTSLFLFLMSKTEVIWGPKIASFAQIFAFFLVLITGLIYMIDTLSLGFLKRIKWLQKVYYPIYVFYGYITLSFTYRSIYYSLISRFPRRYTMAVMLPFIIFFSMVPFHKYDQYQFFPDEDYTVELQSIHYANQRTEDAYIAKASIPSMIIKSAFLPLFIRYHVEHNASIRSLCTDYEPSKSSGFISGIHIGTDGISLQNPNVDEADPQKLLNCLSQLYHVYLNDSLYSNLEYYYLENSPKGEKGIQTMLPTEGLPKGKNTIKITRQLFRDSTSVEQDYVSIPFWLE